MVTKCSSNNIKDTLYTRDLWLSRISSSLPTLKHTRSPYSKAIKCTNKSVPELQGVASAAFAIGPWCSPTVGGPLTSPLVTLRSWLSLPSTVARPHSLSAGPNHFICSCRHMMGYAIGKQKPSQLTQYSKGEGAGGCRSHCVKRPHPLIGVGGDTWNEGSQKTASFSRGNRVNTDNK